MIERALAVVAHPDDEAWAMGGTLALWASLGAEVRVLSMTAGEAGGDPTIRRAEFAASCAALGVTGDVLDLPDGSLASVRGGPALVRDVVGAFAPSVVLTLGPDGGYAHLDHQAVTRWVDRCGAPILHAVFPPGLLHPVWRGLRRAKFPGVAKGLSREQFGSADADVVVDIASVHERKRAAIAAHASQLRGRGPEDFLLPGLLDSLGSTERWAEPR